ncbi:MAG: PQQ-binding-like beta-propeller repeat protein, partial [Planctomycetota bacterium]
DAQVDESAALPADERQPLQANSARPAVCPGDRWPMFRGVGTSVSAALDLPLDWSDDAGVAWRLALPGYGQSSPVMWGDRVFLTTMQGAEKETATILCIDRATGAELWRREFPSSQRVAASRFVSRGAPTPCVDAEAVYAFFESGDLVSLSHDGQPRWQRSLVEDYGSIEGNHGIGGSPLLVAGSLFVPVNHGGPSYLLAVDPANGDTVWKKDFEPRVGWSSLAALPSGDETAIVLSAAGAVEAFAAGTGDSMWRVEGLEGNNVPTPTIVEEWLYVGAQDKASNMAIRASADDGASAAIAWRSDSATSSFGSPLAYRGRVYFVNRSGVAFCLNAADGELIWKERIGESCWASPIAAEDRLYFFGNSGETSVYSTEGDAQRLAVNSLEIPSDTRVYGVAVADRQFLIRTGSELICVAPSL